MNLCQHQFDDRTCASPALTGQDLCYFHSRDRNRNPNPATPANLETALTLPDLTDPAAVLAALSTLAQAISQNNIDPKRANLLLRVLTLAAKLTTTIEKAAEKDSPKPDAPPPATATKADTLQPHQKTSQSEPPKRPLPQQYHPQNRLPRGLREKIKARQTAA